MAEITLQNTKAEILAALQATLAENKEYVSKLELTQKELSDANTALFKSQEDLNVANKKITELTATKSDSPEADAPLITDPVLSETQQHVTVCIPYIKGLAQGNELQLALRGWHQNFKEEFNVVVIGDREDWMSDLVHVIECERISTNPPLDVVNKMLLAIESDLVTEKFVWANDDQYLVSPCMLADFEFLKYFGNLAESTFGSTMYQKNKAKTAQLLMQSNLPTLDFSVHFPVVFEKQKLKEVIEKFEMTVNPLLVTTIYQNYWFPGFVPFKLDDNRENLEFDNLKVGVYRIEADLDRLKKLIPRKKLISNSESGWSPKLSEVLNSFFSFKCKFEN